jgi:hypothetical protein
VARIILSCAFASLCCASLSAQLRPLEPLPWDALVQPAPVHVSARLAWFDAQRAALAGTVGRLIELGEVRALVQVGPVRLEFAGTPQRIFEDDSVVAPPTGGAAPPPQDGERHDAGDYRVGTVIPLVNRGVQAVLRFGTRLPTTDNRVGLDRDQTDFFALVGAFYGRSLWRAGGELGLGINGTRSTVSEQADVLLYSGTLEYVHHIFSPRLVIVGQDDLRANAIRGNEDLSELRAVARIGGTRWLELAFVQGLRRYSPRAGFWIGGGFAPGGKRSF